MLGLGTQVFKISQDNIKARGIKNSLEIRLYRFIGEWDPIYDGFRSLIFLACLAELQNGIPDKFM